MIRKYQLYWFVYRTLGAVDVTYGHAQLWASLCTWIVPGTES